MGTGVGAGAGAPDTGAAYATANVILRWTGASGASQAWLRLGTGDAWDRAGSHALLLAGLGTSLTRGRVAIDLSLVETRLAATDRILTLAPPAVVVDTPGVPPAGPTTVHQLVGGGVWRDLRAQLRWSGRSIEASLAGGAHVGAQFGDTMGRTTGWVRAEATAWLTRQIGVVLGAGRGSPLLLEAGPPLGPLTLALRVAVGRSSKPLAPGHSPAHADPSFDVRSVAGDLRSLRVRVPHAKQVELTADFVEWRVLILAPAGNGVWEARVTIPPGSHRVSIRIDGGPWIAPPGLPPVGDDFTGAAGLLRVE